MDIEEIERNVLQWAFDKGILFPENSKNQLLKSFEEMGEIARAILKSDKNKIKDGIGDVLVTLTILANNEGFDLKTCFEYAYNEIKNRKGKTINGTFIKN